MVNVGQAVKNEVQIGSKTLKTSDDLEFEQRLKDYMRYSGITQEVRKQMLFLINNFEEYKLFRRDFWPGDRAKQNEGILAFRKYKLEQNQMTYEEFLVNFNKNTIESLEKLFQHPVSKSELRYFLKMIKSNEMTLEFIYQKHMEIPTASLASILTKEVNFPRKQTTLDSLNLAPGCRRYLNFLIKSEDDLNSFLNNYWTNRNNQVTALVRFWQYKLHERNMQLDEFLNLYQTNPVNGLEELFLEKFYQSDVDELESQITAGKLTLERLYYLHKDMPEQRMRYFLVRGAA